MGKKLNLFEIYFLLIFFRKKYFEIKLYKITFFIKVQKLLENNDNL